MIHFHLMVGVSYVIPDGKENEFTEATDDTITFTRIHFHYRFSDGHK